MEANTGDWCAVYIHTDGVSVVGPFLNESVAFGSILEHYVREFGDTYADAHARYAESGDEWVTRIGAE